MFGLSGFQSGLLVAAVLGMGAMAAYANHLSGELDSANQNTHVANGQVREAKRELKGSEARNRELIEQRDRESKAAIRLRRERDEQRRQTDALRGQLSEASANDPDAAECLDRPFPADVVAIMRNHAAGGGAGHDDGLREGAPAVVDDGTGPGTGVRGDLPRDGGLLDADD